jgi:hypothetical protein
MIITDLKISKNKYNNIFQILDEQRATKKIMEE